MADLSYNEKKVIESFLEMESGVVLDFTNASFQEFVWDSVRRDIDHLDYNNASNSKANRLRAFFKIESNQVVGKLLRAFNQYKILKSQFNKSDLLTNSFLNTELIKIIDKLEKDSIVDEINSIKPNNDEKDFVELAEQIRDLIEKGKLEIGLDRLHTFLVKFIKQICKNHNIEIYKDETLNAIFGKYVKFLKENNLVETEMTLKILKFSISIIDSFNSVRNNKSLAHDNPILNYEESKLIFNNIAYLIGFINHVEYNNELNKVSQKEEFPF